MVRAANGRCLANYIYTVAVAGMQIVSRNLAIDSHNADLARRLILKSNYWVQAVNGEHY